MSALEIHAQEAPFAQTVLEASPVSVLVAALVTRTAMVVQRIILWILPAVRTIRVRQESPASKIRTLEPTFASAVKDLSAMRAPRSVAMLTNALRTDRRHAEVMLFARTFPEVTSAIAHRASMETLTLAVTSVTVPSVNASPRTNSSVASASWLVATLAENVPRERNAFPLLED